MDLALIWQQMPSFIHGAWVTISMVGLALFFGILLAIPMALAQAYKVPVLGKAATVYSYMFRGTPLLVQLYILYYGLAQFAAITIASFEPMLLKNSTLIEKQAADSILPMSGSICDDGVKAGSTSGAVL